ncbi:MAG: LysM peptidoglycan-binding domain-containing protein [Bacteroidota bacterium]
MNIVILRAMLKKHFLICLFLVLNGAFFIAQTNDKQSCKEVLLRSLKAINEVKGLKYHLKIIERGRKGFNNYESSVKYTRSPKKVYLYIKGIEVLYTPGLGEKKALVKPNSFPYFNLNLDPMGDLMRSDQHHTINEMGYDYFASVIQHAVDKIGDRFDEVFSLAGEEKINNRICYKVVIDNKDFKYIDYTIQENESITSIARKYFVPEYLIVEKNPKFKDYFDILKKGEVIKIPNWYCQRTVMYIDKFYHLPVSVNVLDDVGLFEEYNYLFIQVNPIFEQGEFTKKFKGYGF